ncbi:putative Peptidase M [Nitrospira japonica]|uniref:Putative Peptidase M n=1 Tax=Nitrospira japonica TaxID=1325564 RepID=A0A1W1I1N2_9BACT|nr:M1 family aminopeptidase [Nitrospira japonica]SLM46891.1 putative Peptidase M [Nitrospira japonica]
MLTGKALLFALALLAATIFQAERSLCEEPLHPSQVTSVQRHDLFVQLYPESHELIGRDRITLVRPGKQAVVRLSLASTLVVQRVAEGSDDSTGHGLDRALPFTIERDVAAPQSQQVVIPLPDGMGENATTTLVITYQGVVNDPPREPRHLRFVTPSETAGHIGPEGVYLSSESQWYPDSQGSLSSYALRVALPKSWTAVTQAAVRRTTACSPDQCRQSDMALIECDPTRPSEALTLVANRFVVKERSWVATSGQPVRLATYLFPEDAHLADEYLDATSRYLDAYVGVLGPYPFETFAVVENFFASGLGMPSFTLLGSAIIKRHYVQPYALGHEIVHSWIGNGVFNRTDTGNWVEGLTTYVANYYWYELTSESFQARDQRRLFVRSYNLHVPPDRDYPVGRFMQKHDERDNAIGYQKTAMAFHLLRQEVGDQAFWKGVQTLISNYLGRHAEWHDLLLVFNETSGRDLGWFFRQWIERGGVPAPSLSRAVARPVDGGAAFDLDIGITQAEPLFRFPVQIRVRMDNGLEHPLTVHMTDAAHSATVRLPNRPVDVRLDPDSLLIRRIPRQSLPPTLNHYVTDIRRTVMLAGSIPPSHPYRELVARIEAQEGRKGISDRAAIIPNAEAAQIPPEGSVLLLGHDGKREIIQPLLATHCGTRVRLTESGIAIEGSDYDGPGTAVIATCHRADRPGSVLSLFYSATPEAAASVSRLLFFYGWNSVVVFKNGSVVSRGEWPGEREAGEQMEVAIDAVPVIR